MPLTFKETSAPIVEPVLLGAAKTQCVIDSGDTGFDSQLVNIWIPAARRFVERKMQRAIYPRGVQLYLDFFPFPEFGGTVNPNDRHCLYGELWHQLAIRLPLPAALAVQSVQYIPLGGSSDADLLTLDAATYYADLAAEPARIVPRPGQYWPYTQSWLPNSVRVNYTAGSGVLAVTGESVVVPAAPGLCALPLAQLAKYVGMTSLADAVGNPVAWAQAADTAGTGAPAPTVAETYAGQTLTANYYVDNCPKTVVQAMLLLISHFYANREASAVNVPKAIELGVDSLLGLESFDTFGY